MTDKLYFNPRPPRGGRHKRFAWRPKMDGISIHAPREGGDSVAVGGGECCGISIHAPREGGDHVLK